MLSYLNLWKYVKTHIDWVRIIQYEMYAPVGVLFLFCFSLCASLGFSVFFVVVGLNFHPARGGECLQSCEEHFDIIHKIYCTRI